MSIVVKVLKNALHKILFQIELKQMDAIWYMFGGNCFEMFSPAFSYTHTEKGIEHIKAETIEELQMIIDQLRGAKYSQS